MSIVEIDERDRMAIPKKWVLKNLGQYHACRSFFITIPIMKTPENAAEKWLLTNIVRKSLKIEADKIAQEMR